MYVRNCLVLIAALSLSAACGGGGGGAQTDAADPVINTLAGLPIAGSVSGSLTLTAQASDDTGVTQTTARVDGVQVAQSAAGVLTFTLDTTILSNAAHTLLITAFDAAGNSAERSFTFTVSNSAGTSTISGTVRIPTDAGPQPAPGALVFIPQRNGSAVGDPPDEPASAFTYTLDDGTFTLTGVAVGLQTVQIELGQFEGTVEVDVQDGANELEDDTLLAEIDTYTTTLVTPTGAETIRANQSRPAVAIVVGRPAMSFARLNGTTTDIVYAIAPNADGSGTWTQVVAATVEFALNGTALAVIDGKPAIAFVETVLDGPDEVKLALSSIPDGSSTWNTFTVEEEIQRMDSDPTLAIINGKPAIAYSCYSYPSFPSTIQPLRELHYAFTSSTNGAGPWAVTVVDDPLATFHEVQGVATGASLAEVAGKPCIAFAYSENEPGFGVVEAIGELRFYIGDSPAQLGGWRAVTVDPDNHGPHPSLAVIDGRPAITYVPDDAAQAPSATVSYATSAQTDGSGGWSTVPVAMSAPGFVLTGRTYLSTLGDGSPQLVCTVGEPGIPGVDFILLATNYTDPDNATFFDDFRLYDAPLQAPLDAQRIVLAGLVDRANRPGIGLATVTGNNVATIAFTTLD